ncbi:MAG: copper homeostasis membrane protein CopD [Novosphingobium sp.]|nr:copper homeostasis membrane protein CopD [Novosphingobium sp.]
MQPDLGLVAARFLSMALLMASVGVPFYLLTDGQVALDRRQRNALGFIALAAICASVWWACASVAAMAATPLFDLDRETLSAVLDATPLGPVLYVRLVAALCLIAILALWPRTLPAFLIAFVALASSAWTGHSGAAEGGLGLFQRLLDVFHLGAGSLWLGALLVFVSSVFRETDHNSLVERLSAFSRTGTIVVCVLAFTGAANTLLIADGDWSPSSGWTLLLAAKLALFAAMLGLAGINRWRLTPALARGETGAERHLLWSLCLESACAIAIVALVATLGMLDPGA